MHKTSIPSTLDVDSITYLYLSLPCGGQNVFQFAIIVNYSSSALNITVLTGRSRLHCSNVPADILKEKHWHFLGCNLFFTGIGWKQICHASKCHYIIENKFSAVCSLRMTGLQESPSSPLITKQARMYRIGQLAPNHIIELTIPKAK